jgi:hypothetical protein
MKIPSRDIGLHVNYLDLNVTLVAQGVSWSPDVADDMTKRMKTLFENSLETLAMYSIITSDDEDDEDDDDYGPVPDKELKDPYTVHVEYGEEGFPNGRNGWGLQ